MYLKKKWNDEITFRYGMAILHLKYVRRFNKKGTVNQYWDAIEAFIKARKIARAVRKLAK